jgi:hypothetical protein
MTRRWLALATFVLIFMGYFALQLRPEVIRMDFQMNAENNRGTFSIAMPVAGQVCLMEDLNMRNGGLPDVVQEYWDFESTHRVAILDQTDTVLFFLMTHSHRASDGSQPVGAASRCIPKKAGEAVTVSIGQRTASTSWWMSIN